MHASGRDNNFDVLRLGAAALVLVSHSWALTGRPEPSFAGQSFGTLGVTIFFAISGFLVARSWTMDPRPAVFALKRFLRLWPALLVVLIGTAYVLGPLVTTTPLGDYFGRSTADYVTLNAGMHVRWGLPGAFAGNPYPDVVNGSLWTLPAEVKAYVLVLALGVAGLLARPAALLAVAAGLVWILATPEMNQPAVIANAIGTNETRLIVVFAGGALLWSLRERIPLDWRLALVAAAVAGLTAHASLTLHTAVWALAVPYLVLMAAYRTGTTARVLVRPGDLSYGIYLWAFPVQQTVILVIGASLGPGWLLLVAAPLTYALAFGSWRLVEAPALALKRRLPVVLRPSRAAA